MTDRTLVETVSKRRSFRVIPVSGVSRRRRSRGRVSKVPCVSWISAARPVPILVDDPAPGKERLVDLQFYHPLARSVRVAGSFSGGQARSLPLQHLGGGAWVARLRLAPGKYQYHFLVDGERKPDPLATELVEDRRGQVSSVMAVG